MSENKDLNFLSLEEYFEAERSPSWPVDFETASQVIKFPKSLKGKTTLEIGGGVSTITKRLSIKGAKALAIDIRYLRLGFLNFKTKQLLNSGSCLFTQDYEDSFNSAGNEEVWARLDNNMGVYGDNPDTRGALSDLRSFHELVIPSKKAELQSRSRRTFNHFFRASQRSQAALNRITASTISLPFKDSSVDFCFSINYLSYVLLRSKMLFFQAISEACRVLQPGGELQIYPWIDPAWVGLHKWSKQEKDNMADLPAFLKTEGIFLTYTQDTDFMLTPTLKISKSYANLLKRN